jgi:DNA invertase Pin-like site-specific DNA recombinase
MIIGYARVSTIEQKLDLQIDALTKYGCERIFEEKKSGKNLDREQLNLLLDIVRPGDKIVVWKLDRIGRSIKDRVILLETLKNKNIHFISLTENIDTSTKMGEFFYHMMSLLAQTERETLIERSNAGREAARARGRFGGRPVKKVDPKKLNLAIKMYNLKEVNCFEAASLSGISHVTFYKKLKENL